jgi:hypothetical protein
VLVLLVLPLRSDSFLEEVVVGFEGEFRDGSNVVLDPVISAKMRRGKNNAYVDPPKLLHRVECNDLLQQIVPVVALLKSQPLSTSNGSCVGIPCHWVAW